MPARIRKWCSSWELRERANPLSNALLGRITNSDKMQVYKGLPVLTNKMPEDERRGIRHHLSNKAEPDMATQPPTSDMMRFSHRSSAVAIS